MRLHRFFLSAFLLLSLSVAGPAFATSVQMTYDGHKGAHSQNGSPYIGYPYYVSVNGAADVKLMCDSFDNDVSLGQTWTATASPFLQGIAKSMFGTSLTEDYKAAGLMFLSVLDNTLNSNTGQWAIWGLFSKFSSSPKGLAYFKANPVFAQTEATYLALAANAPDSAFKGLVLYTPLNAKPGVGPQEFIGYSPVPEPSSLVLLGTGLVGLAGTLRRRFAKV